MKCAPGALVGSLDSWKAPGNKIPLVSCSRWCTLSHPWVRLVRALACRSFPSAVVSVGNHLVAIENQQGIDP
jgi:hypothetical protein